MSAAPMLNDEPIERPPDPTGLSPYLVQLRSSVAPGLGAHRGAELSSGLATRLGITITFDALGYRAEFVIVAEDDSDAVATARRRWFYLATDLELPTWPITHIDVTPLSRTHSATW